MAFCPNCGAAVEGRFCAKCGASVGAADASAPPAPQQSWGNPGAAPGAQPYGGQQYTPPGATPHGVPPSGAQAGGLTQNVAGALAYILGLITGIIFLVLAPYNQNRFVRFHAFQSIFLHGAWIAFWIVNMVLTAMLPWSLMIISSLFSMLIAVGGLVLWIFCMVKAYNNEMFKIPVLGDLAEKQA